ncbi:MAG: cold shock domain-containing protein [Xanthobacteraceae bacterium]
MNVKHVGNPMQQQIKIEFQGMAPVTRLRQEISQHVSALESRYGRITTCRVVLKAPSARRRAGGAYEVNIRLALPNGREVDVARTADLDERHADVTFAINDAFKRARRRLQDRVRRMQGQAKVHEEQLIGTVTKLEPVEKLGVIETSDGQEIYFHPNAVLNGGYSKLKIGSRVSFHEEPGNKGPQASTVRVMGKHKLKLG